MYKRQAYLTVSGQNSNNSVRVTDEFLSAVAEDGDWNLTSVSYTHLTLPTSDLV